MQMKPIIQEMVNLEYYLVQIATSKKSYDELVKKHVPAIKLSIKKIREAEPDKALSILVDYLDMRVNEDDANRFTDCCRLVACMTQHYCSEKYEASWSTAEDEYVRSEYGKKSASDIAKVLGRTMDGVYQRARILGLTKTQENPRETKSREKREWTAKEEHYIKDNMYRQTEDYIAKRINRTVKEVIEKEDKYGKRFRGVKKPKKEKK